jgi:2-polyprenyl-3-methyl-5-hydroxy-6-metoxy-1,4-benzoquinol methylase
MNQDNPASQHTGTDDEPDWFEEWFRSDFYLKLYSHRDQQEAEDCIDLILRSIGMTSDQGSPGSALDLAAGPGRHAIELAGRGFNVTAVDLSPTLLSVAERGATEAGVDIRFIRSDMREIVFEHEFDLVLQLFTSFGYFEDRSDDALVLERVRSAIRNRGYYALDLINEQRLRETLIPESTRTLGGLTVREERRIIDGRVEKTITIPHGGGERRFVESVRLYSPETIDSMLREAGFEPLGWFGDYSGRLYDREASDRMMVISRAR